MVLINVLFNFAPFYQPAIIAKLNIKQNIIALGWSNYYFVAHSDENILQQQFNLYTSTHGLGAYSLISTLPTHDQL